MRRERGGEREEWERVGREKERERERERIISFSTTDQISFNCVYPSYFSSSYYQHWESLPLFALPHPFVSLAFGPHGQDGGQGSKPCGIFGKNQGKARVYLSHVTILEKLVIPKKNLWRNMGNMNDLKSWFVLLWQWNPSTYVSTLVALMIKMTFNTHFVLNFKNLYLYYLLLKFCESYVNWATIFSLIPLIAIFHHLSSLNLCIGMVRTLLHMLSI